MGFYRISGMSSAGGRLVLPAPTALLTAVLLAAFAAPAATDDIRVFVNVESRDVYAGEAFLMQISVDGAEDVSPPDMSSVKGFTVTYMGGSNNSSHSISIINGKVERTVKKGFVLTYQLTPRGTGHLEIPPIEIDVGGTTFRTEPVAINVKKPEESEDFKLRIKLSRETCYVGEPVVLAVTWYLARDIESFNFTAPVLESDAFDFETPEVNIDRQKKYFRIPLGDGEVIAEKGQSVLEGQSFVTLSFSIALIPKRGGRFIIPEFIVSCESGTGIRSSRDFFEDFFRDGYSGSWRGSLKKYVVPSNSLSLDVKDLPLEGRPEGFAGHVGELRISTKAEPVEVSVGDPITLTVTIEGPDYLGRIDLPPLESQKDMAERFKIPEERADGRIEGKKKVFTQTLRARNDSVTEIPPVRIAYFDTGRERYVTARSEPIPITVKPTRVVTASDAEGMDRGPVGAPLEKWKEGIAFNYEGPILLEPYEAGLGTLASTPGLMALLIAPPAIFFILLILKRLALSRTADPQGRKARGAFKRLSTDLRSLSEEKAGSPQKFCGAVMEAYKAYLGDKLSRRGGALTAAEIERILLDKGVEPELAASAREAMGMCETGAFAGGLDAGHSGGHLVKMVLETAGRLDRKL